MIYKIRLAEARNPLLREYNASLGRHFSRINVKLADSDEDDYFISIVHVESPEDLTRVKRYKEMGTSTIAILHTIEDMDFFELVYQEKAVDRFVVHHRFFQEIVSREIYDSTRVLFYPFPTENPGFTEEAGRYVLIPRDATDEEVKRAAMERFDTLEMEIDSPLPSPNEVSLILLPYSGERFETIFSLYKVLPLQRPIVLSRIPPFEEFAFRELTPEVLYTAGKPDMGIRTVERILSRGRLREYFTYVMRGYVMSYTFHRYARFLKKVMIDVTPEEFRNLYVI